ncbi:hypothetical protein HpDR96b_11990 [Helicobacter pylori]
MYQLEIKTLGQVFTPKNIVDFMLTLKHNQGSVLEPSAGDGSFLKRLKKAVGIEIDPKICPKNALCMDFFDYPLENQFDTIIGNPPYVKHKDIAPSTKKKLHYSLFDERSNLYLFFIEKAIKHLKPKGELIFITPRDFLKSTSSVKLNEWIYEEGTITHFFELGDQKIFPNAMPNCVVFRFCKGDFSRITNDGLQFVCKKGILYFLNQSYTQKLSEVFKVKVGAVSGCDKIFKNETYGNLEFVTSITKRTNVAIKHLKPKGELIFITPRDFLKSTSSVKLNEWIYEEGTITHFFELGDQKIFPNAMPNCVVFRFCKGDFSRITNDGLQFVCKKGILYFLNQSYTQKLSEVFKVKVGAVSGCDKIFKNETYGNLEFVTSITKRTNVLEKMVFVNKPNDYLLQHKDSLMQRKIKKFNESNWFEWGRMHHVSPKKRIYVNAKTRQKNPFFIHQCPNYDGSILALFPYDQNLDLQNLCDKLNAINWQELGFVCDGRFLFSQRSLENALLPKDFFN